MLIACVIWGCAFAVMKDALDAITPNYILAFRFTIAAVLMGIFYVEKARRNLRKGMVGRPSGWGVDVWGIPIANRGVAIYNSRQKCILTAVCVVLVPFMLWGVRHIRPDKFNVIAAVLLSCWA